MKIALTGAHGVGKSTLATALKEKMHAIGKSASITPEIPRIVCGVVSDNEYFRRGRNSPLKQSLIMIGQLVIEEQKRADADIQICDRTLVDHWAYTLQAFTESFSEERYIETFEKFISDHCSSYEQIFYLPIEFAPVDDGVREDDVAFQRDIDKRISDLYQKFGIALVAVTGSVEQRVDIIIQSLKLTN